MRWSDGSGGMSDGALDVLAQPEAVGEHLGQGQDREAEDQRAADGGCEQAPVPLAGRVETSHSLRTMTR
jgi:hypothetical protein